MQIHLSSIILCLYMYMKKIIIATAHPGKSEAHTWKPMETLLSLSAPVEAPEVRTC